MTTLDDGFFPASVHHALLDLLPVHAESLDTGVISSGSRAKTFRIGLPDDLNWEQWLSAFERCYHFTLRSLSSPSPSGGSHRPHLDLDLDTQQSVLSILACGLPLPKSPSIQLVDLANGPAGDPGQLEREERGWWSLRFQQVLREVQRRQDLHLPM
jgi:serine/arginine repetitive matrix protein 2